MQDRKAALNGSTIIETTSWGTPPAPGALVARAGSVPTAARPPAKAAPATGSGGETGSGFGVLGVLGGVIVLGAAAAMVWSLRR